MKNIGEVIKEARIRKKLSREKLENLTKIKKGFIEALENSRWDALPDYPVVFGFVKSIAGSLGLEEKNLTALLRRDYPPKALWVNPKPDLREKFKWNPRLTFLVSVITLFLIVAFYLGFSYLNFIQPPFLELEAPKENQLVEKTLLTVKGKTDQGAFVEVNNQPVLVEESGFFETEIEIAEETNVSINTALGRMRYALINLRRMIKDREEVLIS